MSIQRKTLLIILLTMASLLGLLFFGFRTLLAASFETLERDKASLDTQRAVAVFQQRIADIHRKSSDWAMWDEACNFIASFSQSFVDNNFTIPTMANLGLSVLIYTDVQGKVVQSLACNLDKQTAASCPDSLLEAIPSFTASLGQRSEIEGRSGIFMLPESPLLLSIRPVVTSNGEGPFRGFVVFGEYLRPALVAQLASSSHFRLSLRRLDIPTGEKLPEQLSPLRPLRVHPLNDTEIAGYALLNDIEGQPRLMVQIVGDRAIWAAGNQVIRMAMVVLVSCFFVMSLLMGILMHSQVLARLQELTRGIDALSQTQDPHLRLRMSGQDELADVGTSVNRLLESLAAATAALRQSETRFRSYFEFGMIGMALSNREKHYIEANQQFAEILGYSRQELQSMKWTEITHPGDIANNQELLTRMASGDIDSFSIEKRYIRKDGQIINAWIDSRALRKPDGSLEYIFSLIQDITARKRSESRLARLNATFLRFSRQPDENIQRLVELLGNSLEGSVVIYSIIEGSQFRVASSWDLPKDFEHRSAAEGRIAMEIANAREGQPLLFRNLKQSKFQKSDPAVMHYGWQAAFGIPVRNRGNTIGVLCVMAPFDIEPTREDLDFLTIIAAAIGIEEGRKISDQRIASQSEELSQARDQAQAAIQAKTDLAVTLSHAVRTPLSAIMGLNGLLSTTQLTNEQRDYLQSLQNVSDGLLQMVDDVLDFSKIDSGLLQLELQEFSLPRLFEEAVDAFASRAAFKGVELLLRIEPGVPTQVVGDPRRIRQILSNLLMNAFKFTFQGQIMVQLSLDEWQRQHTQVRCKVVDTGIGMERDQIQTTFQPFLPTESAISRKHEGIGIGLALCQRLVALMKGEIGAESKPDEGSTFWFTLPLGSTPTYLPCIVPLPTVKGKHSLTIVPHPGASWILHSYLLELGMTSDQIDASKAMEILDKGTFHPSYDLVVIDDVPGEISTRQLTEKIRSVYEGKILPIVLLSTVVRETNARMIPGVTLHLRKPVKPSSLRTCLTEIFSGKAWEKPSVQSIPSGERMTARAKFRILVAEDNQVNQKVTSTMVSKLGYVVEVAGNGHEVIHALSRNSFQTILMDCQMPEMDGFEATRRIRNMSGPISRIPIIALTAHALPGEQKKCFSMGMDDFLTKPPTKEDLERILDCWTLQRQISGTIPSTTPLSWNIFTADAQPVASPITGVFKPDFNQDIDQIDRKLKELQNMLGVEEMAEVWNLFVQGAPRYLEAIDQSIGLQEIEGLKFHAHSFKGMCSNIGATGMQRICKDIEILGSQGALQKARDRFHLLQEGWQLLTAAIAAGRFPSPKV